MRAPSGPAAPGRAPPRSASPARATPRAGTAALLEQPRLRVGRVVERRVRERDPADGGVEQPAVVLPGVRRGLVEQRVRLLVELALPAARERHPVARRADSQWLSVNATSTRSTGWTRPRGSGRLVVELASVEGRRLPRRPRARPSAPGGRRARRPRPRSPRAARPRARRARSARDERAGSRRAFWPKGVGVSSALTSTTAYSSAPTRSGPRLGAAARSRRPPGQRRPEAVAAKRSSPPSGNTSPSWRRRGHRRCEQCCAAELPQPFRPPAPPPRAPGTRPRPGSPGGSEREHCGEHRQARPARSAHSQAPTRTRCRA